MKNPEMVKFLLEFLPGCVGQTVSFSQLNGEVAKRGLGPVPEKDAWIRAIERIRMKLPGLDLSVRQRKAVHVLPVTEFIILQRRLHRTKTKAKMAGELWRLLLGDQAVNGRVSGSTGDEVVHRLKAMHEGGVLTIFTDAGSTLELFFEELENLNDLALSFDGIKSNSRLRKERLPIRLRIVTTSLAIAESLAWSKHRSNIEIYPVGGQVFPHYMSMAGFITQKLLPIYGELFSNCIGIVGASGCRSEEERGGASLLCNSMEEMMVKQWILRNADLSIAIFGIDKVKVNYLPHVFAPLKSVDLVVTDNGTEETDDNDLEEAANAFRLTRNAQNTATLIAGEQSGANRYEI